MTCKLCDLVANKELSSAMKLYEDEWVLAVLSRRPASMCHVIILPKSHYTIIEMVPDDIIAGVFGIANKISRAMFESLNIQGTNIFVQNGVAAGQEEPHFSVHIIARVENDGVRLSWEPKKLSEEEMSTIELKYKQLTDGAVFSPETKPAAKEEDKKGAKGDKEEEEEGDDDEENYMLKYYNKMP